MITTESLTKKWKILTRTILEGYFREQDSLPNPSSSWCFWGSSESVKDTPDQINRKRELFDSCNTLTVGPVFGVRQPNSNVIIHIATPHLSDEKFGEFFVKLVKEYFSASDACKYHMAPLIIGLFKELAPHVNVDIGGDLAREATRLCNYFNRSKSSDSSDLISIWVAGLPNSKFEKRPGGSGFNQEFSAIVDALDHGVYPVFRA